MTVFGLKTSNAKAILVTAVATGIALTHTFCASQMRPTGGEPDETAPLVHNCTPKVGTVNFPKNGKISLTFSEWIEEKRAEKSVSIFPYPEEGLKVTVAGRVLTVAPKSPFDDSTTYHLEISNTLQDLRGNPIGVPYHVYFSTGPTLDSGEVSGCIPGAEHQKESPKVGLFRHDTGAVVDTLLLGMPSYLVQTDSLGRFAFTNIRKGTYDIIAFVDTDNNSKLTAGRENCFAPVEKTFVLDRSAPEQVLFPSLGDTLPQTVSSVRAKGPNMLLCQWQSDFPVTIAVFDSLWTIQPVDSGAKPVSISSFSPIGKGRRFLIHLQDSLDTKAYYLVYPRYGRVGHETVVDSLLDSIRFNGTAAADTTGPEVAGAAHFTNARLSAAPWIAWSEPVRTTNSEWFASDTLGDTVALSADTGFCDTIYLHPKRSLGLNKSYTITWPGSLFVDLEGTFFSDTTDTPRVSISLTTVSENKLCYSLSGGDTCLPKDQSRTWEFKPIEGRSTPYYTPDSGGTFCFDSLPATKGTIGYFSDTNKDGLPTLGMLFPWLSPELYVTFNDTIEARARWDIEGIPLPRCDQCPPLIPELPDTISDTINTSVPGQPQ